LNQNLGMEIEPVSKLSCAPSRRAEKFVLAKKRRGQRGADKKKKRGKLQRVELRGGGGGGCKKGKNAVRSKAASTYSSKKKKGWGGGVGIGEGIFWEQGASFSGEEHQEKEKKTL